MLKNIKNEIWIIAANWIGIAIAQWMTFLLSTHKRMNTNFYTWMCTQEKEGRTSQDMLRSDVSYEVLSLS